MKRVTALILAVCMVIVLNGCKKWGKTTDIDIAGVPYIITIKGKWELYSGIIGKTKKYKRKVDRITVRFVDENEMGGTFSFKKKKQLWLETFQNAAKEEGRQCRALDDTKISGYDAANILTYSDLDRRICTIVSCEKGDILLLYEYLKGTTTDDEVMNNIKSIKVK